MMRFMGDRARRCHSPGVIKDAVARSGAEYENRDPREINRKHAVDVIAGRSSQATGSIRLAGRHGAYQPVRAQ